MGKALLPECSLISLDMIRGAPSLIGQHFAIHEYWLKFTGPKQ